MSNDSRHLIDHAVSHRQSEINDFMVNIDMLCKQQNCYDSLDPDFVCCGF